MSVACEVLWGCGYDTMSSVPSVVRPAGQPDLVAEAAKVFGNTVRLSIVNALRQGPALRADLVERTGLPAKTLEIGRASCRERV